MNKFFKSALCTALALFIVQSGFACTNVLVTKGASKDGSILITYSADSHNLYGELYFTPAGFFKPGTWMNINEWDSGKYLGQIPQLVGQTYQTVGNMNEHQLIITETTFGGRRGLHDPDGIMDYGSLIYITLQRAKTAREAIQTIVDLANEYTPDADIIALVKVTDIIAELMGDKLDGAFIETAVAENYAVSYPELAVILDVPYDVEGSSVGVVKGNAALLAGVNMAIAAAIAVVINKGEEIA